MQRDVNINKDLIQMIYHYLINFGRLYALNQFVKKSHTAIKYIFNIILTKD